MYQLFINFEYCPINRGLDHNQLSGNIPNFITFKNLQKFNCNDNQLTGSIPDFINLTKMKKLHLYNNNLSGCIPQDELCKIEQRDTNSIFNIRLENNPLLPYKGDIPDICNLGSQIGAKCDDGLTTTIEDHILSDCSCLGAIADTCLVTVYDTITVMDTITVIKEIAVTDTLIINLNLVNSINQPVMNTILVYPNPASSHIYVDMGDYTLLENYDMQILNTLGQPVYFTTIDKKLYYLDLNSWSGKGTYFLKIKNPNGTTIETKKIVLQ